MRAFTAEVSRQRNFQRARQGAPTPKFRASETSNAPARARIDFETRET